VRNITTAFTRGNLSGDAAKSDYTQRQSRSVQDEDEDG